MGKRKNIIKKGHERGKEKNNLRILVSLNHHRKLIYW
jgi:hypothetical protein